MLLLGCGLNDREVGVRYSAEAEVFSSPPHPGRNWSPSSLLYNGDKVSGRDAHKLSPFAPRLKPREANRTPVLHIIHGITT